MKQIYIFALLLMGILSGCGSNQKDTKEETQRMFQLESVDENSSLQRMQVSRINQEIACKGKKFQLSIERTPDEKLPHVKSDMGLFMDNSIKVKIARENGTALFEKKFTKRDTQTKEKIRNPKRIRKRKAQRREFQNQIPKRKEDQTRKEKKRKENKKVFKPNPINSKKYLVEDLERRRVPWRRMKNLRSRGMSERNKADIS